MADIIQLLPDSVANQIAAGEVIQRPASLVKELVENAVDAGATEIKVLIRDAGKELVQVIDNGCGMSDTDARLAFERHATSKIRKAEDLFAIRTMGFRGEALASIAAIAQLEIKTRKQEEDLGTQIRIAGSKVESQEPVSCPPGTNISVKNLFFNIPARRRFLKTNSTELRHLTIEFQRIVLTLPQVTFALYHNDSEIYNLPSVQALPQRLAGVFGKAILPNLIPVHTDTSIVKVTGHIGKPEFARKTFGEQFFFVNHRFMRHPYFHKAITEAYNEILPPETIPSYFIYFDIDPVSIDINIHPTKMEIKFEDERAVWQILHASIREALGRFNIVPSLDFESEGVIDIPVLSKDTEIHHPQVPVNPGFNPFNSNRQSPGTPPPQDPFYKDDLRQWEKLYQGLESTTPDQGSSHTAGPDQQSAIDIGDSAHLNKLFQFKNRYILTPVKSGLMVIDQKRAHERILYEYFLELKGSERGDSQKSLFPHTVELNPADHMLLLEILSDLNHIGFDIQDLGNNAIIINGFPSNADAQNPQQIIESLLEAYKISQSDPKISHTENIAAACARASAISYGNPLSPEAMQDLVDRLFACRNSNYSPFGKSILTIIPLDEFEEKLK